METRDGLGVYEEMGSRGAVAYRSLDPLGGRALLRLGKVGSFDQAGGRVA